MKSFLDFSDYLESKELLRHAGNNLPKIKLTYESRKYCKVPLFESLDSDKKIYISLKPKDRIEILWAYISETQHHPIYINIISENQEETPMYFTWGDEKVQRWIEQTICKI